MFDSVKLENCFSDLIGWEDHYNTDEIGPLGEELNKSTTGEFFQDFHPAMRLDYIKACLPQDRDLGEFLKKTTSNGITQLINDIATIRKYKRTVRENLATETLLHGYGWVKDAVINEGRFVGFRITPTNQTGLEIQIKRIGFQFTKEQKDLTIYLYNSNKLLVEKEIKFSSDKPIDWTWIEEEITIQAENEDHSGGSYLLGYYQDDIVGQAINFKNYNFRTGPCSSCDGGVKHKHWKNFHKYAAVHAIYIPAPLLDKDRNMIDLRDTIIDYDNNYGMNIRITASCDLTNFFCEHRHSLKKAYALKVVYLIMKEMQFSMEINHIEENLKMDIIRDLEGDKDTNYVNITDQLNEEIKAVNFDHNGLSMPCLPCNNANAPKYGAV